MKRWEIITYNIVSNFPFKLNFFDIFGNLKAFHSFDLKNLEQLSGKKVLKWALLGNRYSELFTEVEIWY